MARIPEWHTWRVYWQRRKRKRLHEKWQELSAKQAQKIVCADDT